MNRTQYRILITPGALGKAGQMKLPSNMEKLENGFFACYLTELEYVLQMDQPDDRWKIPGTKIYGIWDDDWYENFVPSVKYGIIGGGKQ